MADVSVLNVLLYGAPIGTLTRVSGDRTLPGAVTMAPADGDEWPPDADDGVHPQSPTNDFGKALYVPEHGRVLDNADDVLDPFGTGPRASITGNKAAKIIVPTYACGLTVYVLIIGTTSTPK